MSAPKEQLTPAMLADLKWMAMTLLKFSQEEAERLMETDIKEWAPEERKVLEHRHRGSGLSRGRRIGCIFLAGRLGRGILRR